MSIGTVLENWCIRRQLTDSVRQLDHLYQTDTLTGLYNRRGYSRFFEDYYRACRDAGTGLAVFLIDMNRMKAINDHYGHAEGDYCLCAIAEAMNSCAQRGEICVRTGGDEFVVLARDYDEEDARAYIEDLRRELDAICDRDGKPYRVSVSIGCCLEVPSRDGGASLQQEAESFLRRADKAMYAEKKRMEGE